jgi:flagellar protein FliS
MTMIPGTAAQRALYNSDAIMSASPARLVTMLYDRLLLDLSRAESAQSSEDWQVASGNLLHAQAIVAELTSSLDVDAWDGAPGLLAVYLYVSSALISANTHRDIERTRESISLLEPLRRTWHEAAAMIPAQVTSPVGAGGTLGFA